MHSRGVRHSLQLSILLVFGLAVTAAGSARAAGALRVVASDATGVTLRFELPTYRVTTVDLPQGRFARIEAPGLQASLGMEGRPVLPAEVGLVAFPANTEPRITVLEQATRVVAETAG